MALKATIVVVASLFVLIDSSSITPRVIGGHDAMPSEFRFQVSLQTKQYNFKSQLLCGGSIINNKWVITAAHCFDLVNHFPKGTLLIVKAGTINLKQIQGQTQNTEQVSEIEKFFRHPSYVIANTQRSPKLYDIALIKLKKSLTFNDYVGPIARPSHKSRPIKTGEIVTIAGWGHVNFNNLNDRKKLPNILKTASVKIIDRRSCNKTMNNRFSADINQMVVCTEPLENPTSPCLGDSGGPLIRKNARKNDNQEPELIGIVSYGITPCGSTTVYTNVQYFNRWIDEIISKN